MENPYYIQRISKSRNFGEKVDREVFWKAVNEGSLVREAYDQVKKICSFDYMGSAEFEFGSVPKAIRLLAENSDKNSVKAIGVKGKTVFILGKTEDIEDIEKFINKASNEEYLRLKECLYFYKKVNGGEEGFAEDICAWLDIDNLFFFTTDKEMFDKFTDLMRR